MKYSKVVTEEFSASARPMCYLPFLHLHVNIFYWIFLKDNFTNGLSQIILLKM